MTPSPPPPIATPCVKVCVIDGDTSLCMGCLRTLAEVAGWVRLGDAGRAAVMANLSSRAARIAPDKRAMFGLKL